MYMPGSIKCWGSGRLHLECRGHEERSWVSKATVWTWPKHIQLLHQSTLLLTSDVTLGKSFCASVSLTVNRGKNTCPIIRVKIR